MQAWYAQLDARVGAHATCKHRGCSCERGTPDGAKVLFAVARARKKAGLDGPLRYRCEDGMCRADMGCCGVARNRRAARVLGRKGLTYRKRAPCAPSVTARGCPTVRRGQARPW